MTTTTHIVPEMTFATPSEKATVKKLFFVIVLLTMFDGIASWVSIAYLGIAMEGNGGLDLISEHIGFGGTMVVRVLWGALASLLLAYLAINFRKESQRRFARRGLWLIAGILFALMIYQIFVMCLGYVGMLTT